MATNLIQPTEQQNDAHNPVDDIHIDSKTVRSTILGLSRTVFFLYTLVFLFTIIATALYYFGRY